VDPNRHDPINDQTACSQNVTFQTGSKSPNFVQRDNKRVPPFARDKQADGEARQVVPLGDVLNFAVQGAGNGGSK
jgi:hypothetical protein